jgi:fatty-acyl-CoA synthase
MRESEVEETRMTVDTAQARASRNTIGDAFRRAAAKHGPREALSFGDRRWSYAALDAAADRVAAGLLGLGLAKGDRVVAYGRNADAYLLAWLGCVRAGLVHVPANYALTATELGYIVEQSGARALLADLALKAAVDVVRGGDLAVGWFAGAGGSIDVLATALDETATRIGPVDLDENDLAQLLYTSGTTAAPKGAMMTHRALLAEYASCLVDCELSLADRSLAALPLYHSAQMHVFLMPHLLVGAVTTLIESPVPEICLGLIEERAITSFFAPPTVWISLLRHPDFDRRNLASLRNIYYGASIMPVPVLEELRRRLPGVRAFNCYGQSEIGPLATVLRPEEHDARPFHSGDVGYLDEEGYLVVVDRVKDIIKTGGVVVASREVEEALFSHPSVSEVAVVGLPDPKWIEAVTAVVVLRPGQQPDEAALIDHARQRLAPFKLPKRVIFAETLPRNTAGKLLKRELRIHYAEGG